jgi:hypothetical protein
VRRLKQLSLLSAALSLAACERDVPWEPLPPAYSGPAHPASEALPFDPASSAALDHNRMSADGSAYAADALAHVPLGILFALAAAFTWHHRRRAVMEQASNTVGPLADGPAVVFGTVERDPSWSGPVVRLDLHQKGTEWCHKGTWHHQWRETHRTLNRRPFVVVRDDGVRVQVEPDERVVLHDETDAVRHAVDARTRVAAIEPGQRVHVSGALAGAALAQSSAGGAYRGGYGVPTLRAPALGRMVISNERPGESSLARMRFHRNWAVAVACVFAFAVTVVMPAYELLWLTGDAAWATPTAVRDWREWHKPKNSAGYWVNRYSVRGVYDHRGAQRTVEDECGVAYHRCVTRGECARVPFTVSWLVPAWHQLGDGPQLTVGRAVVLGLMSLILLIAYPVSVRNTRPWYMKKRVVDGGNGRLANAR